MRRPQGAALVVTLVLLGGLGALALAAAAAAMAALSLAGHQQAAQSAFEAAEAAIVHALAAARATRADGRIDWTLHADGTATAASYAAQTTGAGDAGPLPAGFSVGANADAFAAESYFIVAEGRAGRGTAVRLEQGFYLVVPAAAP